MSNPEITYEEANPFSTEDFQDQVSKNFSKEVPDKPWAEVFRYYGATVEEDKAMWNLKKTEDNVSHAPTTADFDETVFAVEVERVHEDQFDFEIEVFEDEITISGSEMSAVDAILKILKMSTRHGFEHHFKTDVPNQIVQEIFENEVLTRDFVGIAGSSSKNGEQDER